MKNEYNKIHEMLVKDSNDFAGMIAYSIYKAEKRDQVKSSSPEQVAAFVKLKSDQREISRYRREAEDLVSKYIQLAVDDALKNVKREIVTQIKKMDLIDGNDEKEYDWRTLHKNGVYGVTGNVYTAILTALFIWAFSSTTAWNQAKDSATDNIQNISNKISPVSNAASEASANNHSK